jgi:cysteine synthase B
MGRPALMRSVVEAVGQTPLLRLHKIERDTPNVKLYLKLEYTNPGGSVKDRPALQMMKDAIADGRLTKDKVLIDATSGNTGVAYSIFGAALGYRIALVMPNNVSQARKNITTAYGTELIFSDPMEGSDGAIRLCRRLVDENPNKYFYSDQYRNPSNPLAHYLGTAGEILEQVGSEITHFVTGLGTSGTCMGVTRRLHEHPRKIICVAAQPAEALHGLEGLKHMGSSIVPEIYNETLPDEHMLVQTEDGWDMADRLAREEGLHVGHSTGANVSAAAAIAKRIERGCVVTIACDRGDRYFAPMRWEKHYEW